MSIRALGVRAAAAHKVQTGWGSVGGCFVRQVAVCTGGAFSVQEFLADGDFVRVVRVYAGWAFVACS